MNSNINLNIDLNGTNNINHTLENCNLRRNVINILALIKHEDVNVNIVDGVVNITGLVASFEERGKVSDCILQLSGVKEVINKLCVDLED